MAQLQETTVKGNLILEGELQPKDNKLILPTNSKIYIGDTELGTGGSGGGTGGINADSPIFENSVSMGRVENSEVGENSIALGVDVIAQTAGTSAFGARTISGAMGYYLLGIETTDTANVVELVLSEQQVQSAPPVDKRDSYNTLEIETSILTENVQEVISGHEIYIMVPHTHYMFCGTVLEVLNNRLRVKNLTLLNEGNGEVEKLFNLEDLVQYWIKNGKLTENDKNITFQELKDREFIDEYDYMICIPQNPTWGTQPMTTGGFAEGIEAYAVGFGSHAEGAQTVSAGSYSHSEGYNTTAGYSAHSEGQGSKAKGRYSHAEGQGTIASGHTAHAEGGDSQATGNKSHAEGFLSKATAEASHAEGKNTTASGIGSHAEGWDSVATGVTAHAEGSNTEATQKGAHAEGNQTHATAAASHAEGYQTYAQANCAHAEGEGTYAEKTNSHAEGKSTHAQGEESHAEGLGTIAQGIASHTEGWDAKTVGNYSHAEGRETFTNADCSHAEGYRVSALGNSAHAEGNSTNKLSTIYTKNTDKETIITDYENAPFSLALGDGSHVEGVNTLALAIAAHAEGSNTIAEALSSHTEGINTYAHNDASHAEGNETHAYGIASHSEGEGTTAVSDYSHAEGWSSKAVGLHSHAEGFETWAEGDSSHAEGISAHAYGDFSHAEGYDTYASGTGSHAEGYDTHAAGTGSHAEGIYTTASGSESHAEGYDTHATSFSTHTEGSKTEASWTASHAEGIGTKTKGIAQHVQGKYNDTTSGNASYIHVVGGGSENNPRNIHLLNNAGSAWFAQGTTTTGADYAEFFEWLDGNPESEDRVGLIVSLDGEMIKLANPGDKILGITSGTAGVLGDNYESEWNGKYLTDDFGRIIYEDVEEFLEVIVGLDEENKPIIEKQSLGFFKHPKLNPNYDASLSYINRQDRPEWEMIGLMGKLYLRDDGSCIPNFYATIGENGVATSSLDETNMRVLSRVNDSIIRVFLK